MSSRSSQPLEAEQQSRSTSPGQCTLPDRIDGDIPVDLDIGRAGKRFLFISRDQRSYTHAIHKYPAKFFPELPRWIVQRFSQPGELVLDPFMGSGTANLEAMLAGRPSVGVDIDPFSRFLARAKTTLLNGEDLRRAVHRLVETIDAYDEFLAVENIPEFPYRDNWFRPYVLKEMGFIKGAITGLDCTPAIRDFLLVTFSSIIRQVSQADNNCTRTVIRQRLNKQVPPGYALNLFRKRLDSNLEGMLTLGDRTTGVPVNIPVGPSATDLSDYPEETFALALTSPPYANAVDYPRTHQLEMYWLGLANGSLRDLKRQHVGTETVLKEEYDSLRHTGIASADRVIESIYEKDPRRAYIVFKFLQDMVKNLVEVRRVVKTGGHYVIATGCNQVRGHTFETWRYLLDIAPILGYQVDSWFVSGIINHFIKVPRKERIDDDYVLVLSKR
ncbi:MAG: hypothetical protein J4G01_02990 [Dehalococcoidia bacterium]|nr:hypothetical protein [Dehalococcoidia bacterium]